MMVCARVIGNRAIACGSLNSIIFFLSISLATAQVPATPTASASVTETAPMPFDIMEFRVLGNSVLAQRVIETAVYPFLGHGKSLLTVQQARDALAAAYRDAGFNTVLVDIPEQSVDAGIVRLRVTEGKVETVHINGAHYFSERQVLQELPSLKPGVVPAFPQLQDELSQLASEARDRQVTPVLKAGDQPGLVAIDLKVQDRAPLHGSLQLDNRYTASTAQGRLTGVLSYENMFQRAETLSVQYETAPQAPSQVRVWALTYLGRTPSPDWTWTAYAVRSNSDVAAIGTLSVIGDGKVLGLRLTRSARAIDAWSNAITLGVDYKDFNQAVTLPASGPAETPIRYLVWSAQYAANRPGERFDTAASVALNFAVQNVGARDAEFDFSRYAAHASFYYLRASDSMSYRFWRKAELGLRFGYQYTNVPLVNNEQFALGGVDSVRGYLEAESLDDQGFDASIELRAPPITYKGGRISVYSFFDAATGRIVQPLPNQAARTDLESWGLGFRGSPVSGLDASLDWANTLRKGPQTPSGEHRFQFSVRYGF